MVKRNYRRARRLAVGSRVAEGADIPNFYAEGVDFSVVPTERRLITGIVLSLDPQIGGQRLRRADRSDRIVAVGTNWRRMGRGHRRVRHDRHAGVRRQPPPHLEGLLRNIGADVPLEGRSSYISHVLHKLAPAFRPEDAYMGNLISALGAIDAGITTLVDWSHIQGSPDHTDAGRPSVGGLGMRAVLRMGSRGGASGRRQPSWFMRAATEHFSTQDQMLTLALAAPGPEFTDFEVTRDRGSWPERPGRITTHVGVGSYGLDAKFEQFGRSGVLGPDTTYIHCTTLNDTEIQMIVDTGGTVSLAPVEMMMGHGMPPLQVPRPGFEPKPQRGRGDQRSQRHVQPDAIGTRLQRAFAAAG